MASPAAASMVAVMLLFSLCLTCVDAAVNTVYHSRTADRDLGERKLQCYMDIDSGLWGDRCKASPIDKENCALSCVSPSCYESVYGNDPLEEGEVDLRRGRQFKACIRGQKLKNMAKVRASIS
ncbi:hypothetical protein KC19_8G030600 [Ceratodon purpureus]|uniref:Uncharacterized protein n=1 Tax=Ceratodon purpureus TaxID=3225 RepID=A0A8T0H059_CERPU|nr:hypothetical protein KC19_8G030600 [Ceratodon purpureus]